MPSAAARTWLSRQPELASITTPFEVAPREWLLGHHHSRSRLPQRKHRPAKRRRPTNSRRTNSRANGPHLAQFRSKLFVFFLTLYLASVAEFVEARKLLIP